MHVYIRKWSLYPIENRCSLEKPCIDVPDIRFRSPLVDNNVLSGFSPMRCKPEEALDHMFDHRGHREDSHQEHAVFTRTCRESLSVLERSPSLPSLRRCFNDHMQFIRMNRATIIDQLENASKVLRRHESSQLRARFFDYISFPASLQCCYGVVDTEKTSKNALATNGARMGPEQKYTPMEGKQLLHILEARKYLHLPIHEYTKFTQMSYMLHISLLFFHAS